MRAAGHVAAGVLIAVLVTAAPVSAKTMKLTGQVVGQPDRAKKGAAVHVLLDAKSAKRARLQSALGVIRVRAKKVKVSGRPRIATRLLQSGDRVRTRAKIGRRARRAPYWRAVARRLTVTERASVLSLAELQELVTALQGDLARLRATVEDLARYTKSEFASMRAEIASLRADLSALRSDFATLAAQVAAAGAQLAALESRLQAQIDALAGDVSGLQAQMQDVLDDIALLNASMASLGARLATLQGALQGLTSDLAAANAAISTLSAQLDDLTGGDLADALADIGALQADLAALEGIVGGPGSGLVQEVNTLSGVVGAAGTGLVDAVAALLASDLSTASDIAALQTAVGAAEDRLDDLEAVVGGPSSGLVQQVNGLQSDVDVLCGPTSPLNALC